LKVPTLTVIVPATDRPETLAACREAIEAAVDGPEEVIVVDVPKHSGPAAARNAGALPASGDVLVFVDADVAVKPDVFQRIRATFVADPGLTAVFGSYDDEPAVDGVVAHFRNLLHHHVHQGAAGPARTFWAGLGAIRQDAFHAIGGFDASEYKLPSMEDIELGMRLDDVGARVKLDNGMQGTHMKAWTLRQMVRSDLVNRGIPWVALLARRRQPSSALNLAWRHRISALATLAAVLGIVARRPRVALAAASAQLALNASFYALLMRRRGPLEAVAGIGLHAVHQLTAIAAVPLGLLAFARERHRPPMLGNALARVEPEPEENALRAPLATS
jgi:GT2 family glycosyltransferase